MKRFKDFVVEAEIIEIFTVLLEAKGPDYSDEHAQINLYNYLVGSGDRRRKLGREIRTAIRNGDFDRVKEIASRELQSSESDPSHPLHFANADPAGFGTKGKTAAHQTPYTERMRRALPWVPCTSSKSCRKKYLLSRLPWGSKGWRTHGI